ncbi:hypothetical protein GOBAR_DD12987 [Gossypium barbadense]|nr:hypothetical protein GOBAR_DD12987 [Gossypium barbadense]
MDMFIQARPIYKNLKPRHYQPKELMIQYIMQRRLENGGLELLCESVKIHNVNVDLPKGADKLSMRDLLAWVRTNLIKERPEMFMKGESVRPGVLVLVNDCDWELSGQLDTTLEEKDLVVFISTLHGG